MCRKECEKDHKLEWKRSDGEMQAVQKCKELALKKRSILDPLPCSIIVFPFEME